MDIQLQCLPESHFPDSLKEIPQKPKKLYLAGTLPDPATHTYIAIVGSRNHTTYGKIATEFIVSALAKLPVVIVSGLALGIDSIAHKKALDVGLATIAIPGSGLAPSAIYPRSHLGLAEEILHKGGALLSEFDPEFRATNWSFAARNRIMAGICSHVIIVEAQKDSGTLITARLGTEYNKTVLAVPGSIFSDASYGTNWLIEQGATPITSKESLFRALGYSESSDTARDYRQDTSLSHEEKLVLSLLSGPKSKDDLLVFSGLSSATLSTTLTLLELKGYIKEAYGELYRI